LVFRAAGGRMSLLLLLRSFDQAMGLAVDEKRLAIGTRYQIWRLRSAPDIAQQLEPRGWHDVCGDKLLISVSPLITNRTCIDIQAFW
jgi:hypothetical protein